MRLRQSVPTWFALAATNCHPENFELRAVRVFNLMSFPDDRYRPIAVIRVMAKMTGVAEGRRRLSLEDCFNAVTDQGPGYHLIRFLDLRCA